MQKAWSSKEEEPYCFFFFFFGGGGGGGGGIFQITRAGQKMVDLAPIWVGR